MKNEIKNRIDQINRGEVPEGYKNTSFGVFPCEWVKHALYNENIKNGEVISVSKQKGAYGINAAACEFNANLSKYIRITDIDDKGNYIDNNACVNSCDSANYILEQNDIVFARTGASVGKNYLYKLKDGHLVYAGFLIKFSINEKECIPYIVYANCNTQSYWNWVKIVCTRSGQPGINAEEFAGFEFYAPRLDEKTKALEQNRIAEILMKCDEGVALQQDYIRKLEARKTALMTNIFDFDCSKGYKFNEVCPSYSYKMKLQTNCYNKTGLFPIIDQGKEKIAGYSNNEDYLINLDKDVILLFGDHTTELKLIDSSCCIGGDGVKLFKGFDKNITTYAYYFLLNNPIKIEGYKRHSSILRGRKIALPILNNNIDNFRIKRIADVLSKADEEIQLNKDKLSTMKQQQKSLMQLLLTGIVRVG